MHKRCKTTVKSWLRKMVTALPPVMIKQIAGVASNRILAMLDHPDIRGKFPVEASPMPFLWNITSNSKGHMSLHGHDCVSLAEQYGTPLLLVDKERLEKNYSTFLKGFSKYYPRVEIGYSYKTNPLPGALQVLHKLGAGAEVVSPNELRLALQLGVAPRRIIYNGPGKTRAGLELAVSNNIGMINIDGFGEIELIDQLAKQYGVKQQVGVRVITSVGWKTKFGFSIEDGSAKHAFQQLKSCAHIDPCGIHFHLSTGVGDVQAYCRAVEETLHFADLLTHETGIAIRYFDLGGGFDTAPTVRYYTDIEKRLMVKNLPVQEASVRSKHPISDYGEAIAELFKNSRTFSNDRLPLIILEPGRAVTCSSQILLLKVLDVKTGRNGVADVILDGGKNVAAPMEWECHALFHASKMNASSRKFYTLYGPLCTPFDQTFQLKILPELSTGDILAVMDAGAYFVSMQSNFCSFPAPSAVLLETGKCKLIRERQAFETMFSHDLGLLFSNSVNDDELALA